MEANAGENENSSPPLEFEDFPQVESSLDAELLFSEMHNQQQKLLTELQMLRSDQSDTEKFVEEMIGYKQQILGLQKLVENTRREGECAAAAAERMVIERDEALKSIAVIQPRLEAMERENSMLEEKARETFGLVEAIKQNEINARAKSIVDDAARSRAESELNRLQQILEEIQNNVSRLEGNLQTISDEIEAGKRLHVILETNEEQCKKKYLIANAKLNYAIRKYMIAPGQLGEVRTEAATDENIVRNDFRETEEDGLMQLVNEEQAAAESLQDDL